MPHAIVQQPNGKFAIWSTIVDDFVLLDATAPEAVCEEIDNLRGRGYPHNEWEAMGKEMENIGRTGRAFDWAPTWDEALKTVRELHGEDVANQRIADAM